MSTPSNTILLHEIAIQCFLLLLELIVSTHKTYWKFWNEIYYLRIEAFQIFWMLVCVWYLYLSQRVTCTEHKEISEGHKKVLIVLTQRSKPSIMICNVLYSKLTDLYTNKTLEASRLAAPWWTKMVSIF